MYSVLYMVDVVHCQLIYISLTEGVTRDVVNILNEIIYWKQVVYSK